MELIDDIQKLCLIKFLHQKHQLTEFHNLLFVCKRWNEIIFENKLYIGIDTKSKIKYHLKDLFISINTYEYKIFIKISRQKDHCVISTYVKYETINFGKYNLLDETCNYLPSSSKLYLTEFIKLNIDKYIIRANRRFCLAWYI